MIAVEHVSKFFADGAVGIEDVSFEVAKGELVALCGDSGSGKTTLLKTLNRLIEPDRGTVRIDGRTTAEMLPHELRRGIGYAFQGTGLFPHLTIEENIGITPRLLGWPSETIAQRVLEMLDLVQLPRALATRRPVALSGGQQQRVGVARALAARPSILLLDEPFGALDPLTRTALGDELRRLHDAMSLATVMVTHDVKEAVLLADRILIMRRGKLIAAGTAAQLRAHPDEGVRALLDAPRRQAERVRARLSEPPQAAPPPPGSSAPQPSAAWQASPPPQDGSSV